MPRRGLTLNLNQISPISPICDSRVCSRPMPAQGVLQFLLQEQWGIMVKVAVVAVPHLATTGSSDCI